MYKNRQIITTEDGSKTIYFPDMDENYHSRHGALQEANHVFLKYGLQFFKDQKRIAVFEVGFGTGLNALLTIDFAKKNNIDILYHTIEAYPVSMKEVEELDFKTLFDDTYLQNLTTHLHQIEWNKEFVLENKVWFTKFHVELQHHHAPSNFYNCIFFDAFAPRVQDALWTKVIFKKMYDCLKNGGLLVTYCAKGQVKRDLKEVGFIVECVEGPPGKREMTLAWKR